jgi:hypothetical protein
MDRDFPGNPVNASTPGADGMLQFMTAGRPVAGGHGKVLAIVRPTWRGVKCAFISLRVSLQTDVVNAHKACSVKFVPGTSTTQCPPNVPHHAPLVSLLQKLLPKILTQVSRFPLVWVYIGT